MRIIICEDNRIQRKSIVEIIENTILREEFDMEIEFQTGNPQEIIDYLEEAPNLIRIYFLDVDLGASLNGIELAEKIRQKDPTSYIVFITSHADMSMMTFQYKIEALDYILKDDFNNIKNRINSCILEAYNRYKLDDDNILSIKVGERLVNIRCEDILFFETSPSKHKIKVHEFNRQIEFYGSLNDIEDKVDGRFIRCHKSFLVNKDNVKEIDKKNRSVHMKNGQVCYASVREMKKLI